MSSVVKNAVADLVAKMRSGDRRAVARLITLVENDPGVAANVSRLIQEYTGGAYVVGVTGAPGSGKSTLVDCLVKLLLERGSRVGVVAVDPTSPFSGGAILGDRIRLKRHFNDPNAFIRSMASRGQLGGIARATKDAVSILDAFGCDHVLVETVGVGQNEVDVHNLAHATLVLTVPGMGDEIQTFKAGLMELTDVFVVNKMDHEGADRLVVEIESMLDLNEKICVDAPAHGVVVKRGCGWRPPVVKTNALTGENVDELWRQVERHREYLENSGEMHARNVRRAKGEIVEILKERLALRVANLMDPANNEELMDVLERVVARELNPYDVADGVEKRLVGTRS
ncbi:MAG: methylmalonyl Co-A mutase-associated GTPase MeaB [Promethearchaeota archaeon]